MDSQVRAWKGRAGKGGAAGLPGTRISSFLLALFFYPACFNFPGGHKLCFQVSGESELWLMCSCLRAHSNFTPYFPFPTTGRHPEAKRLKLLLEMLTWWPLILQRLSCDQTRHASTHHHHVPGQCGGTQLYLGHDDNRLIFRVSETLDQVGPYRSQGN